MDTSGKSILVGAIYFCSSFQINSSLAVPNLDNWERLNGYQQFNFLSLQRPVTQPQATVLPHSSITLTVNSDNAQLRPDDDHD